MNILKGSSFVKNSSILAIGTAFAFAIAFLFQPLLTRLYDPSEFGTFSLFNSVFGILVAVSSLRYEAAIVVPKEERSAAALTIGVIVISLLYSLLLLPIIYLGFEELCYWLSIDVEGAKWLYLVPVSVFLFSSFRAVNTWLIRMKYFKTSSVNKVIRRSVEGLMQLVFAKVIVMPFGLILGTVVGDFANNVHGGRKFLGSRYLFKGLQKDEVKAELVKYKAYPIAGALPYLLNTVSLLLPVVIFNRVFTEEMTGQFGLSRMVLSIPLSLISMSLGQVLSQNFAERKNKKQEIFPVLLKISVVLGIMAIFGCSIMVFFSQEIFDLVYGDQWQMAAEISSMMVLAFGVSFIVSPMSVLFVSIERVKEGAYWQFVHFAAILLLFTVEFQSVMEFIEMYVWIEVISYLIYYLLILWEASKFDRKLV